MKVDHLQIVQASIGHLPDFLCALQAWLYDCTTASIRSVRKQLNILQQRAYASGFATIRCWKQWAFLLRPYNLQTVNSFVLQGRKLSQPSQLPTVQFIPVCTLEQCTALQYTVTVIGKTTLLQACCIAASTPANGQSETGSIISSTQRIARPSGLDTRRKAFPGPAESHSAALTGGL